MGGLFQSLARAVEESFNLQGKYSYGHRGSKALSEEEKSYYSLVPNDHESAWEWRTCVVL